MYFEIMDKQHYDNEQLAVIRKSVGTQEEVAEMLGYSVVQLSRAENGKSASYELLCEICDLAKVNVKDIIKSNKNFLQTT